MGRPEVAGWPGAFRGSAAVAAGLVTWARLRGPSFHRVYPDTYVPATALPLTFADLSRAAYRWADGRGVLGGYSAAELWGADCAPWRAPVEIVVPGSPRAPRGVLLHRTALHPGEIHRIGDVRLTSPLRTAFDLGCGSELVEAVVAVDALARTQQFNPDLLLNFAVRYPRTRGVAGLPEVLALADRRSGSPPETRLRLLLVRAGLPRPDVQHPVLDDVRQRAVWLDLAYPECRVAVEYEGADHTVPERVLRDTGRYTRLVAAGWRIYRYTRFEIRDEPDRIVAEVARAIGFHG
ncbi:MAG: DUF559 domain-containing protein [Pseudonocardia sp.]|nr:DUF559 domain-containing protein [Pseudonocardia sp.]